MNPVAKENRKDIHPGFVFLVYGIKLLVECLILFFNSEIELLVSILILNVAVAIIAAGICKNMEHTLIAAGIYVLLSLVIFPIVSSLEISQGHLLIGNSIDKNFGNFLSGGIFLLPITFITQLIVSGLMLAKGKTINGKNV